jgi:hypothetical protein
MARPGSPATSTTTTAKRLTKVRLGITELDASGITLASYVEPVLETVPAHGRAYFDITVPDEGLSYHVTAHSWNTLDEPSR